MKTSTFTAFSVAALALTACQAEKPPRVATSITAHVLCSETFVAGRNPDAIWNEMLRPTQGLELVSGAIRYRVDYQRREVRATLAGGFASRAAYSEGRGCTVVNRAAPPPIRSDAEVQFATDPLHAPDGLVRAADPRIEAALDRAFAETPGEPKLNEKAIVIVRGGRIIAERYAHGYGPDTRMLSWSAAKSVTNALVGVLVRKGRLSVDGPAPVAAWRDPADPRHPVSIDQLLRQTSGQPFGSANSGFDRATWMQFLEPDTAAYAAAAKFTGKPGERWSYTDGNYQILSGIVRDTVGGSADDAARFVHAELFGPLGMTTAVMEYDEAGAPMGATNVLASARDWARFGQLYLHDGVINGRRILPAGWADYSSRSTPQTSLGYGAGFWTNRGVGHGAAVRRSWGEPTDSFFANGNFGQTVLISPAEDLVVARFGFSHDKDGRADTERLARLAGEVLALLKGSR